MKLKYVYEPKGRAREYGALALNVYSNCDFGCLYCYCRGMGYNQTKTPHCRLDFKLLEADLEQVKGQTVFLCFTCDPYCRAEDELKATRRTLELFHSYNVKPMILSKAGTRILRDLDLLKDAQVSATLTFKNEEMRRTWEPLSAPTADKIEALKKLHETGIFTWVSFEPVIDPEQTLELIDDVAFVDLIKVGKMNHNRSLEQKIDWTVFGRKAIEKLRKMEKAYYVKEDLQKYL